VPASSGPLPEEGKARTGFKDSKGDTTKKTQKTTKKRNSSFMS